MTEAKYPRKVIYRRSILFGLRVSVQVQLSPLLYSHAETRYLKGKEGTKESVLIKAAKKWKGRLKETGIRYTLSKAHLWGTNPFN